MSSFAKSVVTTLLLLAILILFIYALGSTLTPLVIAFIMAYLLFPSIQKLESKGVPRIVAIGAIILLVVVTLLIVSYLILPGLLSDANSLLKDLPSIIEKLSLKVKDLVFTSQIAESLNIDSATTSLKEILSKSSNGIFIGLKKSLSNIGSLISSILGIVLIPLFFFYFVSDWEKISSALVSFIPKPRREKLSKYIELTNQVLSGYIRGQLLVVLCLAFLYSVGLWAIGLKYGFLIGLVAGFVSLVPYLGSMLGIGAALTVATTSGAEVSLYIAILIIFGVVQAFEGFVITPKLVGGKVGLSAFASILALIMGGNLFGLAGMILAIPMAAILKSLIKELKSEYQKSDFYKTGSL